MGALICVLGGDTRSFSDTIAALYFLLKHVQEHLVARVLSLEQSLGAIFCHNAFLFCLVGISYRQGLHTGALPYEHQI